MSVQDAYIYGFALQQSDMSSETPEDFAAEAQRQMRDYAAALADYPHLVEVVGGYVAKAGYDYDGRVPLRPRRDPRPLGAAARRAVMEPRASCLNGLDSVAAMRPAR